MASLVRDVGVVPTGPGRSCALLDHSWDLAPLPQGGVIASVGLRAAAAGLKDRSQELRTATAVFAGRVRTGELGVEAQSLRQRRSASQMVVTVRNPGSAPGTTCLAIFGGPRPGAEIRRRGPAEGGAARNVPLRPGPPDAAGEPSAALPFWE